MSSADHAGAEPPWRLDLLGAVPGLKWLVQRRWFQWAIVLPNLLVFLMFLAAGLFGSPVGNHNFIIVFVWILWWFVLISVLVPFASRAWCAACPIPFLGEWMQRGALVSPRAVASRDAKAGAARAGTVIGHNRYFGWNLRWPKALSNIWLQNIGFLALCTFSALLLTRPLVTVVALAGLFVVATLLHVVFRQRAFCNYLCPVSGFLSLYSMASTLEVRARSAQVCADCKEKSCLAGGENGWGCPWSQYPSKLERNNYCGLCMECVKSCAHDNMAINLRPPFSDGAFKGYDEAFKAFIMLSLAVMYSVIYLGPWGRFKDWANVAESHDLAGFAAYAAVLWVSALVVLPGLWWIAVQIGRRLSGTATPGSRPVFLGFAYPLVPLGLLAWIAFSVQLVLVNGSYIVMACSDPFGWGWDLFGTAHIAWTPVMPHWAPYLQVPLLLAGLHHALVTGYAHAMRLYTDRRQALRAFAPVAVLLTSVVLALLGLFTG